MIRIIKIPKNKKLNIYIHNKDIIFMGKKVTGQFHRNPVLTIVNDEYNNKDAIMLEIVDAY